MAKKLASARALWLARVDPFLLEQRIMHFETTEELTHLIGSFEQQELAHGDWDHSAHLAVCCWYVMKHGSRAEDVLRSGIQRLNCSLGVVTTSTSGYHETLTLFWLAKVRALVCRSAGTDLEIVNEVIRTLGDKQLVLVHYSRALILSSKARREWCEPDLCGVC